MDVTMPQFGETVAEATVTRWLKREGEQVAEGEPLFEVSTDKVDMEVPSTAAGVLEGVAVKEDQTVPVGTVLAVIKTAAGPARARPASSDAEHKGPEPVTPLVRRLLKEHGLEAADVTGTGPRGRITRQDVVDAVAAREAAASQASPPASQASAPPAVAPAVPAAPDAVAQPASGPAARPAAASRPITGTGSDYRVPFTTIRRLTAEHMVRSKATSPHTLMAIEVDYSAVDRVRRSSGEQWRAQEGSSLTYLPFLARAVVDAIAQYPHVNASVGENELIVHRAVGLGIAVDLDGDGLVVPVVRDAEGKRLRALAREIAGLARAARGKSAGPDAFASGTFTISNPGPFGTLLTGAIINQPQVAILATDAVTARPVAVPLEDGQYAVAVHPVGNLALTFDHRAIDGGYAARFLAAVKEIVEHRDWAAEL